MDTKDFSTLVKDHVLPVQTVLYEDMTIEESLKELRKRKIEDQVIYFYVVDHENHLKGIVPSRKLLLKAPDTLIGDIMEKTVAHIPCDQTLEKAMELLLHHHLLALPVTDEQNRFIGCIDVRIYMEESVDIADARFRRDVFQMIGLTIEEGKKPSAFKSYYKRMPWILCNMFGGIACAVISKYYELILLKVILFAMFIPLVLSLSESISMQSMTQSMQTIRDKFNISWKRLAYQTFLEGRVVVLLALTSGIIVGLISLLWGEGFEPAFIIAGSLWVSISIAACVGAAVPLILHIKKLDPKVASGPIVLALADIVTTGIYLSLATWLLL